MSVNLLDKRKSPRFPVTIFARNKDLASGRETPVHTFDISATGIGLMSDQEIPLDKLLEITLCMPDNGEQVHAVGKAVWTSLAGPHKYRVGVILEDSVLKPIPLVLRTIRMRSRYYS